MARVYDALKRAERERKQLARAEGSAVASPVPEHPAAAADGSDLPDRAVPGPAAGLPQGFVEPSRSSGSSEINKRRISLLQPDSYVAEQFRALRGRIDAIASQRPVRTVSITSAFPGEGKTTCAINLAIVTGMSLKRRTLLIDCDLRRPKVHEALGLRPDLGIAEVLMGVESIDDAVISAEGIELDVLAVRGRPANPSELLGSPEMRALIEEVRGRYDRVILDTPAALGLPDAKAVTDLCDGTVMVVRANVTGQSDIQAVLEIVDERRILGLLLNGVDVDQGRYGYVE